MNNIFDQQESKQILDNQEEQSKSKISNKKPLRLYTDASMGLISSASLGHVSIEDSEEIESLAKPIIMIEQKPTKTNDFKLSLGNMSPLPEMQKVINNGHNRYSCEVSLNMYDKSKDEEDFISAKMIKQWNDEIGNQDNPEKALKKIDKMRRLSGLDSSDSRIDVPNARIGLCMLAELNFDRGLKMYALESLLASLKNDDFSKESSYRLVELAIKVLDLINRETIETVDLETEIKLTEVYKVLAETLHIHAGKHHFNGITAETKSSLITAATAIMRLNRLDNVKIRFNIACAREWLRWLKDDTQELYVLSEKLYNLILAGGALYFDDALAAYERLERALEFKDPRLPKHPWHWHNTLSIMRRLARDVKTIDLDHSQSIGESKDFTEKKPGVITNSHFKPSKGKKEKLVFHTEILQLLTLIGKKYPKLDWKFSIGAIETLFDLALNGKTPEIRMQAFKGINFRENSANNKKAKAVMLPGLAHFASCKTLGKTLKKKSMIHLELPEIASQDRIVRDGCVDYLIELIKKSNDDAIIRKATNLLCARALYENHDPIRMKIEDFLNEKSIDYSPRKKEKKLSFRSSL